MSWYKIAQEHGERGSEERIKKILRSHPLFLKLMDEYHIPVEDLNNNLSITFVDLDGKFAEGNGREIRLDKSLLDDGNFLEDNFHYVVHEFWHWVKRRSEEIFYFNDEEEIQSFALGIAWELLRGQSVSSIAKTIYPIIQGHFDQEEQAMIMFKKMLTKAKELINVFKNA